MKSLGRIIGTAFVAGALGYLIGFFGPMIVNFEATPLLWLAELGGMVGFVLGLLVGMARELKSYALGRIISTAFKVGGVAFFLGFVGPLIIYGSEGGAGPLLGIFFTGPLGFLLGLIAGVIREIRRALA